MSAVSYDISAGENRALCSSAALPGDGVDAAPNSGPVLDRAQPSVMAACGGRSSTPVLARHRERTPGLGVTSPPSEQGGICSVAALILNWRAGRRSEPSRPESDGVGGIFASAKTNLAPKVGNPAPIQSFLLEGRHGGSAAAVVSAPYLPELGRAASVARPLFWVSRS